jgi:hypothetical protein
MKGERKIIGTRGLDGTHDISVGFVAVSTEPLPLALIPS